MAIIDLTIEKPALKRVESTDGPAANDHEPEDETDALDIYPTTDESDTETDDVADGGRSRTRRAISATGVLIAAAAGVLTVRKLRARRSGDPDER